MEDLFIFMYTCTCGFQHRISRIYFCRHCLKLRCAECVSHEVDSHYCQNCLEYMPSPEARLKKNKCSNCFICPSCKHTLSTRATSVQVPLPEDPEKTVPKKVYYLVCGFCRWTSRDVGIPDQFTATGGWQEKENKHQPRITILMEHYRMLAQKEKMEKERKKVTQRCSFIHFPDKYGASNLVQRKLTSLTTSSSMLKKEKDVEPSVGVEASSEVEPLPEKYLTEPLNLSKVCTIPQRLSQPQFQPSTAEQLHPQQKYLHIKRSQRCKECEHNLSKPEYNPASIKFKIQLAAFYLIPDVYCKEIPPLSFQEETTMEIILCNPTPHLAHISLLLLELTPEEVEERNLAKVVLPPGTFILSARDDTAEYDDNCDTQQFKDDPNFVTFRKSNKLGLNIKVTPLKKGPVLISFILKHDFVNTFVQLQGDHKEPQVVLLTHTIRANLGNAVQS